MIVKMMVKMMVLKIVYAGVEDEDDSKSKSKGDSIESGVYWCFDDSIKNSVC